MPAHAAVLLAAGGSRRLGQAKQLLTRDGETLVHRAARLLHDTRPCRLVVVAGAQGDAVESAVDDLNAMVVRNDDWQAGLSASLGVAGAALAGFDGQVLVTTCDQPALEAVHLHALLMGAADSPSGCAALLHNGLAGVPAVVPVAWLHSQPSRKDDRGDVGLGARLRAIPQQELHLLDAAEAAFDIDSPDDVVFAVARGWLDPPTAR
ncbi:nucleotidyltransferase family protein [Luteimonas aestuarii]|uniref:Nucleotidyltransferase family protein n=1 Tax=Luteimonas aestuarii TaxID=453837 RepID=A0A4R5TTS4_9GAMM|nr:nucleotidyltransferase family protein [Luteimonas aestuarii]TDK24410.1 nucleotidyltransferase family protein [Luteimonas aestuarii]